MPKPKPEWDVHLECAWNRADLAAMRRWEALKIAPLTALCNPDPVGRGDRSDSTYLCPPTGTIRW